MYTDPLKLFREIALTRSVSKGAEAVGITPSAASQSINELERSMKVRLLDRTTRPVSLTPEGKLYADFCRDVLSRYDELQAALAAVECSVRVAAIYSVGLSEMTRLEEKLHRRMPGVLLSVDYLRPEKVYEAVEHDQVDLGLVSYPEASREVAVVPWREEQMVLVVAAEHPLAGAPSVDAHDLEGVQFIAFDADLPIARDIGRYLRTAGVEVEVSMHFDNLQMIKEAVSLGSGVSILPKRLLQAELAMGRLAAIPLSGEGLSRPLGIVYRKRKVFTRAAQAFLDLLQEEPEPVAALTS
ncbi:MAG TPA: LysR family transcriptional regulator [Bryobacteraceae bacterium]|nr:LysR family transcriptional regulator [Bryobacteraceae bacterium]